MVEVRAFGTHRPDMIKLDIIDNLTDDWTVNDFADFLHYRFQNGDREPRRYWYQYGSLLAKLVRRGWGGGVGRRGRPHAGRRDVP